MMPVVLLARDRRPDCTLGATTLPSGVILKSLELPWLGNKSNISCYPDGVYVAKWIERSASGKYKRCWHVQNVKRRSGILWHSGNLLRHTRGCTLPGLRHGRLGGQVAVLSSGAGLNKMRQELGGQDFLLVVYSVIM